jgi:peptidoglycan/LPS O-acetylase OafA/YrhL
MRGVAAFGVICIHSGLAVHNRTTPAAGILLPEIFGFAVPFFLMTSFFFAVRAEVARWLPWGDWMQRRAGRLLIPFVFWSAVYLVLHIGKLLLHHQGNEIKGLLDDPAELVLNGGTSVALYFLPLVFTGLVLVHLLSRVWKSFPAWALLIGFAAALALRALRSHLGTLYHLDTPTLAEAPLKLGIGLLEDGLRCLPLVFAAGFLTRCLPSPATRNAYPLLLAGAILMIIPHLVTLPSWSSDSVPGVGAFLLAWGLSGLLPTSKWAVTVGLFSFGVYLVHQIYLELIQVVYPYRAPAGAMQILIITTAVFAVSMVTVGLANRSGNLMRKIFGLK